MQRHGGFKGLYVLEGGPLCTGIGVFKGLYALKIGYLCSGVGFKGFYVSQARGVMGWRVAESRLLCVGMWSCAVKKG